MQCHTSSRLIFPPTFDTHRDRAGGGAGVGAVEDVGREHGVPDDKGLAAGDGGVGAGGPASDGAAGRSSGDARAGGKLDLVTGIAASVGVGGVAGDVAGHAGGHAGRDLEGNERLKKGKKMRVPRKQMDCDGPEEEACKVFLLRTQMTAATEVGYS